MVKVAANLCLHIAQSVIPSFDKLGFKDSFSGWITIILVIVYNFVCVVAVLLGGAFFGIGVVLAMFGWEDPKKKKSRENDIEMGGADNGAGETRATKGGPNIERRVEGDSTV